jgi:1-acyl-sn-glycerol-3-phosphate acyltransferase
MNVAGRFLCGVVRTGTNAMCRIERSALQQVPKQGPLIIVTNHIGSLEVPLVFAHLQPRPLTGFAKIETWDNKFMGWLFDQWEAIPIRRGELDLEAVRRGMSVLQSGGILAIAPEGTRSYHGRLLRARPGVVPIAMRSGAPILPLAHWGAEQFPDNIKQLKRTDFHIRVGRPFHIKSSNGKMTRDDRQQIVDEIMGQIAALMPEEYRGEYTAHATAMPKYLKYLE